MEILALTQNTDLVSDTGFLKTTFKWVQLANQRNHASVTIGTVQLSSFQYLKTVNNESL